MDNAVVGVVRWKRYGHDRLYVSTDDTNLGYFDLVSDEPHAQSADHRDIVAMAAFDWKEAQLAKTVPTTHSEDEPVIDADESIDSVNVADAEHSNRDPAGTARPWLDLSLNRPGAEAREQAVAARNASPVSTFMARALGVRTNERSWRIGADGEEKVAAQLRKLAKMNPRWRSIHAVPVGAQGSDIDHVVVGPGGVFTLNAKHHPDAKIWVSGTTFMVDGHRQHYIRNSRYEADRASKLLGDMLACDVHVEGVIVPVNAADVVVKKRPVGVHVVPRKQIAQWLLRHGDILSVNDCDTIYDVARRSTTWQP